MRAPPVTEAARGAPAYKLEINGVDHTKRIGARLISASVYLHAGHKADTVELELDDAPSGAGATIAAPAVGMPVKLWLGYGDALALMGSFTVDQWTKRGGAGGRTLHVSAKAAELTTAIRQPRARSYHGQTLGQIAAAVAGRHGLTPTVDADLAGQPIDHIDQQHESDLHFMTRLAQRSGAVFQIGDGHLILARKGSTRLASGNPKPLMTLRPQDVTEWTATSAHRGDFASASASYGDKKHGKRGQEVAGAGSPRHRSRVLFATKDEAARAARAAMGDLKRGVANFETEGPGLPQAFPEMAVDVLGFDAAVDGRHTVQRTTHVFEGRGYRTTLELELFGAVTDGEADPS